MCKYLFLSVSLAEFPPEADLRQGFGGWWFIWGVPQEALVGRWGGGTWRGIEARQGSIKIMVGSQGSALLGTSGQGYE